MSRPNHEKGFYTVSDLSKMFNLDISKTSLLKYEEKGFIPKAERIKRGQSAYRAWRTNDLPLVGQHVGYLKKPTSPKVVSVFSLKGGTGKTTFAFQFARTLALHNIRTLVIGLDAQESITQTIRRAVASPAEQPLGLYHILAENLNPSKCVLPTDLPTLSYIPETIELSVVDRFLKAKVRKEYIIKEKIVEPLSKKFDAILFDCNPSWSDLVTSTLASTDILISPLGCDINSLKAAKIFVELLAEFQTEMRQTFNTFFIIPTLVENNKLSHQILSKYRLDYEKLCTVSSIRRTVSVQEANVVGRSLLEIGYQSPVYQDFLTVFSEINSAMVDEEQQRAIV